MEQANTKSVAEFFQGYVKLKSIPLDTVDPGAESVDLVFNRKLTPGQKTSLKKEVSNLLEKNFYQSLRLRLL